MFQSSLPYLEETKRHGSTLFPFNIYPCTIPKDFPTVALHWHKSMELIYVKKGTGQVQLGNDHYTARPGDIFIIPPDTLHAMRETEHQSMEYENFIFEVEFLGRSAADICAQQYLIPLSAGQLLQPLLISTEHESYDRISRCLIQAEDLCEEKGPGYELGVKAAMLQLLLQLIRMQPQPSTAETADTRRLKQVLQLVQQNFSQKLTVAQAAESCGFSTSHFMRWFRATTGSSFSGYVKECRLSAAAEKLRLTDDKILTIAHETGYDSLANFNRQFKARYGITPMQYRGGRA